MRRMSFFLTPRQLLGRTKDVTRRTGRVWEALLPGDEILAIHKSQGLRKGEKQRVLAKLRVKSALPERVCEADRNGEATREGFPAMTGEEFVRFFCKAMKCDPQTIVTRIEFAVVEQYVTLEAWDAEHMRARRRVA